MVTLKPYTTVDGIPTYRDSEIIELYGRIIDDGYDYIFHGSSITDGQSFVRAMKNCLLNVVYLEESPVGVCWLNRFEEDTARIHFCSFRTAGTRTIEIGKATIRQLFEKTRFKAFIGHIPSSNRLAIEYTVRVGAKVIGKLPLEKEITILFFGEE